MVDPKLAACRGKLYGMVTLIFASGMVAGALSMHVAQRTLLRPKPLLLTQPEKAMALQHFYQELDLNEQQARAIESILDEFIMQQADLMVRYHNSRLSGHDRILEVLNEEQRKRFQKVLSELKNQRSD